MQSYLQTKGNVLDISSLSTGSVASGTMDLYHEAGCWAWDVCAGSIIAQEA